MFLRSFVKKNNNIKPIGLKNINLNCYMNSVVQCLFHLTKFRDYFINNNFSKEDKPVSFELKNIMEKLNDQNNRTPFGLTEFKKIMSDIDDCFKGSNGADASDLLRYIFSYLSSEQTQCIGLNISQMSSYNINTNDLEKCYKECRDRIGDNTALKFVTNYIKTQNQCLNGDKHGFFYSKHKPFYEVENQSIIDINIKAYNDLSIFFNNYSSSKESIEFCPECNDEVKCESKKNFYKTSDYLIINIDYEKNSELNKKISYKSQLSIRIENSNSYYYFAFIGAVFHKGKFSSSGHYFACCSAENKLYLLDDTQVEVLTQKKFNNIYYDKENIPCIFFYEKK